MQCSVATEWSGIRQAVWCASARCLEECSVAGGRYCCVAWVVGWSTCDTGSAAAWRSAWRCEQRAWYLVLNILAAWSHPSLVRGTRLTRSTAAFHADAKASLLLGGTPGTAEHGLPQPPRQQPSPSSISRTGSPSMAQRRPRPSSRQPSTKYSPTHTTVSDGRKKRKTEGKRERTQNEHPLLEASIAVLAVLAVLAHYLQVGEELEVRRILVVLTTPKHPST